MSRDGSPSLVESEEQDRLAGEASAWPGRLQGNAARVDCGAQRSPESSLGKGFIWASGTPDRPLSMATPHRA